MYAIPHRQERSGSNGTHNDSSSANGDSTPDHSDTASDTTDGAARHENSNVANAPQAPACTKPHDVAHHENSNLADALQSLALTEPCRTTSRETSNGGNDTPSSQSTEPRLLPRHENSKAANTAHAQADTEPPRAAEHEIPTIINIPLPPHIAASLRSLDNADHSPPTGATTDHTTHPPQSTEPHQPAPTLCLNCGNGHHDWMRCSNLCQWCHTKSHSHFPCAQKGANWYQWIGQEAAAGREYCLTCGGTGHGAERCVCRCQFCWSKDHERKVCPKKFACVTCGWEGCHWQVCTRRCRWCDGLEHRGAICGMRCVKKAKVCKRCVDLGHEWEECTSQCRFCLTVGHVGEVCPDRFSCLTCGEEGCHYMRCRKVCRRCGTKDHPCRLCPLKDDEREDVGEEHGEGEFHNGYRSEQENDGLNWLEEGIWHQHIRE